MGESAPKLRPLTGLERLAPWTRFGTYNEQRRRVDLWVEPPRRRTILYSAGYSQLPRPVRLVFPRLVYVTYSGLRDRHWYFERDWLGVGHLTDDDQVLPLGLPHTARDRCCMSGDDRDYTPVETFWCSSFRYRTRSISSGQWPKAAVYDPAWGRDPTVSGSDSGVEPMSLNDLVTGYYAQVFFATPSVRWVSLPWAREETSS